MKYIFIVYLLVFVSCVGKRNNFIGSTKTFPLVVRDTLNVKCEDLGNPCLILPYKNFILLADNSRGELLTLYDLNGKNVTKVLEKGKAENEALIVTSVGKVGNDELYVYDDFGKKKLYFSIDSNQCRLTRISKVDDFCSSIETENFVICTLDSVDCRFKVEDKRSGDCCFLGDYSLYENARTSGVGLADGLLVVNGQQNRFAWFSNAGVSWCVAFLDDKNTNIVYQKIFQEPEFEEMNGKDGLVAVFSDKTVIGFTSVTASQDYIFAMFNGKSYSEVLRNPKKDNLLCNDMCVYDWDGNLLGNIKLNIETKDIYYNEDTDEMNLIGINSRGECQIFTIDKHTIYSVIKTFGDGV